MSYSGHHRYRIISPINSPRETSPNPPHLATPIPPPTLDTSDVGSDSDSDTVIDDSGREGSSTPDSRETSVPPTHRTPRFAGLNDETIPEQAIAATIPYEIIINIFRFFEPFSVDNYNCLFVCKSWTKCAVENVWFRPSLRNLPPFLKFTSMLTPNRKTPALFPYAQFVRRLNLMYIAKDITPRYFEMLEGCTQLERLTMGGAKQVPDPVIARIIPKFQRLLALDINKLDLGDEGLCAVAESCRLLQGLNISHCTRVTDRSVMVVAENCHNLRRVSWFLSHN
jgi:F-box-like